MLQEQGVKLRHGQALPHIPRRDTDTLGHLLVELGPSLGVAQGLVPVEPVTLGIGGLQAAFL